MKSFRHAFAVFLNANAKLQRFYETSKFFLAFFYFLLLLFARFCLYIIIIGMFSTAFGRFFALF